MLASRRDAPGPGGAQQQRVFARGTSGPQPQPRSPAALAAASCRQHAAAPAGAGPPQHPPAASSVVVSWFVGSVVDACGVFVMIRETGLG